MARRSIGAPLTIGIVLTVLVLALAVGWQALVWNDLRPLGESSSRLDWVLLILGSIFFLLVMIGLVWLCTWLVAEVRLNQRQRAFLDAVTHEMKTPLASFRLGLDTLGRYELEPGRRSEFIQRMQEDLDRLDHTVAQVLAAARAEERGRVAHRSREGVELMDVLEDCVARLYERFPLPEGAVRIQGNEVSRVRGDAAELELVFNNLLENAVKYSDECSRTRSSIRMSPSRCGSPFAPDRTAASTWRSRIAVSGFRSVNCARSSSASIARAAMFSGRSRGSASGSSLFAAW